MTQSISNPILDDSEDFTLHNHSYDDEDEYYIRSNMIY